AIEQGSNRGASTLSQQTVKNVYLWHGRSWPRKAMEALATPLVEAIWTKRRILEVYLNIAEFDEGVFGAEAAARHYFGIPASDLSRAQSARLAAILPDPKDRSASQPSGFVRSRAAQIADGAATISRDGRADCFES
ncbi:MAG: monofunctional biosynthetic peptidoglycan transglycosylase, partial [Rhodobacteraceae bacterium]|nr:monofunctional biosynthetic peptidoglycan transglycosylase [Paracoccaceae bacterium]